MLRAPTIKTIFKEAFPVAKLRLQGHMLAPPISSRASQIGTAFDYLLRFYLERLFPTCVTTAWVAEDTIDELNRSPIESGQDWLSEATLKLQAAQTAHRGYLDTGKIEDDLLCATLDLAQVDAFYRTGRMYDFVGADPKDAQDLRNLLDVATRRFPKPSHTCYLNPDFGKASSLVRGADADLIVDGTLIDIKTTKTLSFKQDMYNQLVGYYLLSRLGKINDKEDVDLASVGVYFARYGLLHAVPTAGIKTTAEDGFMGLFEKSARAMFVR